MPIVKSIIYDYFKEKLEEEKQKPDAVTFSPSSCSNCKRRLFFKFTNAPVTNPITEHALLKMELGSNVHQLIQDILKDRGVYVSGEELKVSGYARLNWRYRVDGLLKVGETDRLLEIKSTYASGWNAVEKAPKQDHLMQLGIYMLLESIDESSLLYIGRDNGFMVEYTVRALPPQKADDPKVLLVFNEEGAIIDDTLTQRILDKIEELRELQKKVEANELPDRDFNLVMKRVGDTEVVYEFQKDKEKYKSDWQCNGYCPYTLLCWADVYKEINNHKFYIKGEYLDA